MANISTICDVFAHDMLLVTFATPVKNNAALQAASTYTVTALDSGLPVTVISVQSGNTVSVTDVYLIVSNPEVGKFYQITFANLTSIDGTAVSPVLCKFYARSTKIDAIISTRPLLYDMTPESTLRKIFSAIGRQDELIGGSRNDRIVPTPT